MKIMFTADWHIKLGQKNVPEAWARDRFYSLFTQVNARKPDVHIIGGDIFDKTPSMEELEIFFDFIMAVTVPTVIFDGNHEATKKGKTFMSNLKRVVSRINSLVTIIDDYTSLYGIDFIPYCRLKDFAAGKHPEFTNRICASHFRAEIPPHVKPEIDLDLFNRWDVVLAGDLHSYENSQRNILYPGSPVTTSFHRHEVETGFIILDTDTLKHEWIGFDLPQLIRKTVQVGDEMVATDYHHTIYEVEGDLADLGAMAVNDLVDKRVVRRSTEAALMLDPAWSIAQEVSEYLLYILQLDESNVNEIMKDLNARNSL